MTSMNVMLFNRDLRLCDNEPFAEASKPGELLPLYIFDPSEWEETELSHRHFQFVLESLEELSSQIQQRGGKLFLAIGEIEAILAELLKAYGSLAIFTAIDTLKKDPIMQWVKKNNQRYYGYGLKNDGESEMTFKARWREYVNSRVIEAPARLQVPANVPEVLFTNPNRVEGIKARGSKIRYGQQGGEEKAKETLDTFIHHRYLKYAENHQMPIASSMSSSRLSAYIAWGNLSVRTIFQQTIEKAGNIRVDERRQFDPFLAKLFLHDKSIRFIKESDVNQIKRCWDEGWYGRWLAGKTGIPFIDAAMRCLDKTGWLNFTLREMVISFICNTLMMDIEKPMHGMAGLLLDYHPEIYAYNVKKMTGFQGDKKLRIIDPIRLGKRLDPDGVFIRRYVQELRGVPAEYIHEPWRYPGFYQLRYEPPIIDVKKANKIAKIEFARLNPADCLTKRQMKKDGAEQLSFDL